MSKKRDPGLQKKGRASEDQHVETAQSRERDRASSLTRRKFLRSAGGVTAAAFVAGGVSLPSLIGSKTVNAAGPPPPCLGMCEVMPQTPADRHNSAADKRNTATNFEAGIAPPANQCNGDEARFEAANFFANYSKGLPRDPSGLGEPDSTAYCQLREAIHNGDFNQANTVPRGGNLKFLNCLGGLVFNIEAPDTAAIDMGTYNADHTPKLIIQPPAFDTNDMAAMAAELYWMAYLRDVPFTDYGVNPVVQQAAGDLTKFVGYRGPRDASGNVTPQNIFRYGPGGTLLPGAYPKALDGPIVSQFLLQDFNVDGISVTPRIISRVPVLNWNPDGTFTFNPAAADYLTSYKEWLVYEQGGSIGNQDVLDQLTPRFPRSMRDLGQIASQDFIFSVYLRTARILAGLGNNALDDGNPYKDFPPNPPKAQTGFATWGISHLTLLVGTAHEAERHAWHHKWNVHRFGRPEEFGGRVHNVVAGPGAGRYPIDQQLLTSPIIDLIGAYNTQLNANRFGGLHETTWLLPQELNAGCPSHPSAPAGHAFSAGGCITMLKAWFKEDFQLPANMLFKINRDGTVRDSYVPGIDGPPLTIGGELDKLAHNLSLGRDMSGVHWRVSDDYAGNLMAEESAIRTLAEQAGTYPEPFTGLSLTKFDGTPATVGI